ncbi:hypothetical protein TWF694_011265 [Orbilia ellipsospora]|uniref:Uncharacterized protein n=1 Tax=Orbilia ellipsospora TaxID=2528407 RepID=A0AAV9X9W2_9PEZI
MEVRTASADRSIWRDLPEDIFRTHLVLLEERTNAVPAETQVFPLPPDVNDGHRRLISIRDEQRLADSFAFLAAVEQGAQSVAAVCLEERTADDSFALTVRFAAVDAIHESLRQSLSVIRQLLADAATATSAASVTTATIAVGNEEHDNYGENLFRSLIRLHHRRLLARLRSSKWEKPKYLSRTHKKPLWQDFTNLIHRVQFLYTKKEKESRLAVETSIASLANLYEQFEDTPLESEYETLSELVRASYKLCTSQHIRTFACRLGEIGPTPQIRSAVKTLRQVEKIAAYERLARTLVQATRQYSNHFRHLEFAYLSPYASVSTSIGYETWAKTCHVHAEIQLIVFYDSRSANPQNYSLPPRVIGTSKYLCHLCYLFMKIHGHYPPPNTHGRLYDQWTVPDLREFDDPLIEKYRRTLKKIDEVITLQTTEAPLWRLEPMTSRENLLDSTEDP